MNYALLDDRHLIATAHQARDPLTSTDLECELLRRFEALVDETEENAPLLDVVEEYEFKADELKDLGGALVRSVPYTVAMLKVLAEAGIENELELKQVLGLADACDGEGIDDPESLRRELTLARQARDAANELSVLVTKLSPQPTV